VWGPASEGYKRGGMDKRKKKIKAFVHSKLLLLRGVCHSIAVSIGGVGIAKSIQISTIVFPV